MVDQNRVMELQQELLALRISDWHDKVFSFQWLLIVFLLVVPWIVWWKLVDRKRTAEIFSFGLLISLVSSVLNGNGLNLMLWSYPYKLIPSSPRAYSFSLSALPVIYMLLYQYFPRWRSFTAATVAMSATVAFIVQPIFSWLNIYQLIKWNYFYSFLSLLFIGMVVRLIQQLVLQRGNKIEEAAPEQTRKSFGFLLPVYKKAHQDRNGDNK